MEGYVVVNQDQLKTKEKCKAVVKGALEEGKSVVVDRTNVERERRVKDWVEYCRGVRRRRDYYYYYYYSSSSSSSSSSS